MTITTRRFAALAVALAFAAAVDVPANQDMAVQEGLKCTVCHDKAGSKLLTSKGKFYEYKGTLAGYDELIREHRKCTSCHSNEPGNLKLTPKGEALKANGTTMHDLGSAVKPKP